MLILAAILTTAFATLKVLDEPPFVDWEWWVVFSPLIVLTAVWVLWTLFVILLAAIFGSRVR